MTEVAQVVVLGAGPAGAACALALARAGVGGVVLVDGERARRERGEGAAVVIGETIPPAARGLLLRLGVWDAFVADGHERCLGSCSAWGSDVLGYNDFLLDPNGPGWHLDRARFDERLRACAGDAGVTIVGDAADLPARARFVVDATGRAAVYARSRGATPQVLDRLSFVYGFFDTTTATSATRLTLLEAVRDGWWYAAALPGARLAVAFAGDAAHVRDAGLGHDAAWFGAVLRTRHLAARLDGCRFLAGSLVSRVATSFLLDRVAGARWLAIGDAAATFDPLAAQGISKAISDGLDGAAAITAALAEDRDLSPALDPTARARFAAYVAERNHFYGLERRWPDSTFWQRRRARTTLAA